MHLLAGDVRAIDDGDAAIDLDQVPGDIVILSSADSELVGLARAANERAPAAPSVRLANVTRLGHPMSVDLFLDKTARHASLVVVRAMGGLGYWPYGLEQLRALARGGGPRLVVVPGEDRWDDGLEAYSTVPAEDCRRLWRYLVEGGAENCRRALAWCDHRLGRGPAPAPPLVLPRARCYRPGQGVVDLSDAVAALDPARPTAAIVFYRALVQGDSTAPIDALIDALAGEGIQALPLFVASLKDRESETFLDEVFARVPPAIVLNTTAFAVSRLGAAHAGTVLDRPGRPVLQVVLAGAIEDAWRESPRGLGPRDLTMNVVLPEVDGRLITRAVSFKAEMPDTGTTTYRPVADRVRFVAAQAAAWVQLSAQPAKNRRIAIVLSNYPDRDGRIANGVGLDTPASAVRVAAAMADAGYDVSGFPPDSAALMGRLLAGQTNARVGLPPHPDRPADAARPDLSHKGRGGAARAATEAPADGENEHASLTPSPLVGEGFAPYPSEARLGAKGEGARVEQTTFSVADYRAFFDSLPATIRDALSARWGTPEDDPFFAGGAFRLAIHRFGNVVVGIQPARGYGIHPKATYHDPDLVPPHHYLAFYAWLRQSFSADAIIHLGKHGNLEWLPGKALGLSETCWPEVALGATPLVYPFIVNDPGEGSQAKRRASAVIVDHLMPAMTRADVHGPLAELETLIDEYYFAAGVDRRRRDYLEKEILATAERHGIDRDLGLVRDEAGAAMRALDSHLCELKEMQIRDGLHVLGASPTDRQRIDTLVAIARVPRSGAHAADASLHRAIAGDLGLGFDPLDWDLVAPWTGPRPEALASVSDVPWRTAGDTVERVEMLAAALVEGFLSKQSHTLSSSGSTGGSAAATPVIEGMDSGQRASAFVEDDRGVGTRTRAVLDWIATDLAMALDRSGDDEIAAVLTALDGRFVAPGPSGAPTRGRPDVLPTGRNFYSVDVRAVPTAAAWALGRRAADALALRYFQDEGVWPRSVAMSAWGTSNMRTGGDDIAQAMALIGAEPVWEAGTGRVPGFRIIPLNELGRPRVDVTLRISGMFRDAFPGQIDLLDSAVRAIAALDEDAEANPIAAAARQAGGSAARIFGAKPGAYGAGLQAPIDTGAWDSRADLADVFLAWGGFAYGGGEQGTAAGDALKARLATADAVFQAQDNREHDILDSDDYYQFMGGLAATVETLKGEAPRVYHGDHSRPERPVVRSLTEEIGRVVRGRASNPKWIAGVMRHGYKGGFEIAATVDYLFGFAATTDAVGDHHFDALYDAYIGDDRVRSFIADANAPALSEIASRFREAIDRGLWSPRANSAYDRLTELIDARREVAE